MNAATKRALLAEFDTVLSLGLLEGAEKAAAPQPAASLDAEIGQMIEQRQQARKNKDFATADRIRDELKARGILLEDTPQGVKWTLQR